jgi:hypothetical protein
VEGAVKLEYRLTMTIAEHGFSDEAAERCLDALLALHPETGPVVAQNTDSGHLTITIALDATDPWAATNLGAGILADSLTQAEVPVTPVLDLCVSAVDREDSTEDVRELIKA